uniref:Uncharacterized protein n=1 Tax=Chromera velia CCMP2878 TaxID=1169474 RepID=A0A0G4FP61_9ALVE|eukprot:Cvel_18016.t1-p1 / transcript=Cvel_18016.t1 / gene=Cvel_18016 / organism=Chromera_velia_CCMP2878 / gene_product=hypothetical protein / transcript_product=hypothetical protein / location=Cvel_scaffold1470:346-2163(-) / protein_length=606 / sequence_SO=supercontig / SO=protein_coding / is_pseudo=false
MEENEELFDRMGFEPVRVPAFPGYARSLWNTTGAEGKNNSITLDCTSLAGLGTGAGWGLGSGLDISDVKEFCSDMQQIAPFEGPLEIDMTGDCSRQLIGTTACLVSHILAIRTAFLRGDEVAVFAEDDISFRPLFDHLNASAAIETWRPSASSVFGSFSAVSGNRSVVSSFSATAEGRETGSEAAEATVESAPPLPLSGRGWAVSLLSEAESLIRDPLKGKCGIVGERIPQMCPRNMVKNQKKFAGTGLEGGDCETLRRYAHLRASLLDGQKDRLALGVQLLTIRDGFYKPYYDFVNAKVYRKEGESCSEWGQRLSSEVCIRAFTPPLCVSHPKQDHLWSAGAYLLNREAISYWYHYFFGLPSPPPNLGTVSDRSTKTSETSSISDERKKQERNENQSDSLRKLLKNLESNCKEETPRIGPRAHTRLRLPYENQPVFMPDQPEVERCLADYNLWGLPQGTRLGGMTVSLVPFALENPEMSGWSDRMEGERGAKLEKILQQNFQLQVLTSHQKYIQDLAECQKEENFAELECRIDFRATPLREDLLADAPIPPKSSLSNSNNNGKKMNKKRKVAYPLKTASQNGNRKGGRKQTGTQKEEDMRSTTER